MEDSKEARQAMTKLRAEHGLEFHQDPGGGEFRDPQTGKTCRVTMMDDEADLETLSAWIAQLKA